LASDRQGRSFDSAGEGRHAMERPTDPKRHAKWSFAHDIADILESERKKNAFERLVVVAAPEVLGDLRSEFGAELQRMVLAEIDKDLTKVATRDLPGHLDKLMPS
jgi:protein required for attachment to host cells